MFLKNVNIFIGVPLERLENELNGYRKDFNTNDIHAEPPFSCDNAKSRNGCYGINGCK